MMVLILFFLYFTGCSTPWYAPYGIHSENDLYDSSSVPLIVDALGDEDPSVRLMAVVALRKIGPEAREAIPALNTMVKDPHRNVRGRAIETLGEMGLNDRESAVGVMPGLVVAANDANASFRLYAVKALHQIAAAFPEKSEQITAQLKKSMSDANRNVSIHAVRAVKEIEPGAPEVIPALKKLLSSQDSSTRRYAILEIDEELYPGNQFFAFLDHMANHDPRATVRRDALLQIKKESEQGQDSGGLYSLIEQSEHGAVQFELLFAEDELPLSFSVEEYVEGYSMPIKMERNKPVFERPGNHRYFIKLHAAGEYRLNREVEHDVDIVVEEGKLSKCRISISGHDLKPPPDPQVRGQMVTYLITFDHTINVEKPVALSQ